MDDVIDVQNSYWLVIEKVEGIETRLFWGFHGEDDGIPVYQSPAPL